MEESSSSKTQTTPCSSQRVQERSVTEASRAAKRVQEQIDVIDQVLPNFSESSSSLTPIPITTTPPPNNLWSSDTSDTAKEPTLAEIVDTYAPIGLQTQFQKLYSILHPCLVVRSTTHQTNGSAFLQGRRGSGKTLVLECCLQAFRDELKARQRQAFRVVYLHGILVPGKHVSVVLTEILMQLSAAAFRESAKNVAHNNDDDNNNNNKEEEAVVEVVEKQAASIEKEKVGSSSPPPAKKKPRNATTTADRLHELLRLKKTTFTNNLQLLNETLQIASVDGVPFLFVLDELDAFLAGSGRSWTTDSRGSAQGHDAAQRQVILYHLLDRVATAGSFVSFVGLTVDQGTMRRLEKRIRSRAEGTSQFLDFGPCPSWDILKQVLLGKLAGASSSSSSSSSLKAQVACVLEESKEENRLVQETLRHDFRLGKDVRWFSRVLGYALALYRQDLLTQLDDSKQTPECQFDAKYLLEAMTDMGASFINDKNRDLVRLESGKVVDPILQALCDLSGPQIALLLSARRILTREGHRDDRSRTAPLTAERLCQEYQTSYRGMSSRYNRSLLEQALEDLCTVGLLRPAADHTGGAPFQYRLEDTYDKTDLSRVPLHLTIDVGRQLSKALDENLLPCSTALREWGRKTN